MSCSVRVIPAATACVRSPELPRLSCALARPRSLTALVGRSRAALAISAVAAVPVIDRLAAPTTSSVCSACFAP